MFNSGILDVTIGLIFIYLLLSFACTAFNEWLEGNLKKRSSNLEAGIRELLNDPDGTDLVDKLYNHPLVFGLFRGQYDPKGSKKNLPSYIPSRNFALALTDIVLSNGKEDGNPNSSTSLREAIGKLENEKVRGALTVLINAAGDNTDRARKNIEEWYDSSMDRVSGWYKRYVQRITVLVACFVAVALNADTINIATRLSYDASLRASVVAAAQGYVNMSNSPALASSGCDSPECVLSESMTTIQNLGLPLGWRADSLPRSIPGWFTKLLGLALTAFAISLGAPFWFDMLNKIMVVRSTVRPKEKSPEEPPVDRVK